MSTLTSNFNQLVTSAKSNLVSETRDTRYLTVGEVSRQGDSYIHKVSSDHAHGEITTNHQLAVGNTKGSRHIAYGEDVKVYHGTTAPDYCDSVIFLGPYVESTSDFKILHPEHSDHILSAGCYQITHQMNMRTKQRMKD